MFKFPWIRTPDFSAIKQLDYDQYWINRGFSIQPILREREKIISKHIPNNCKILDIGCGNSRLPLFLKEKGCDVNVADISIVALNEFKKIGIKTLFLDLRDISNISIDKNYDYIILSEILEHLPNPEEVITKIATFSKTIIITIPNSAYFWFRLGLMFKGRFFTQWVNHPSEHLRFWSHIDFLDWLKAMNFDIYRYEASNGPKLLNKIWTNLFGFQIVYFVNSKNNK